MTLAAAAPGSPFRRLAFCVLQPLGGDADVFGFAKLKIDGCRAGG
jgi:hypothetical protein